MGVLTLNRVHALFRLKLHLLISTLLLSTQSPAPHALAEPVIIPVIARLLAMKCVDVKVRSGLYAYIPPPHKVAAAMPEACAVLLPIRQLLRVVLVEA
jgi:hypothetical protein